MLKQVMVYPLSEYDGTMKTKEWSKIPEVAAASSGEGETKWVFPEKFFDELPMVLADMRHRFREKKRAMHRCGLFSRR